MSKQLITFKLHLLSWPLPLHRYLAVCFMPITCLCGCAYLSFAASVCSCLICEPWFSVSLTPSYQVRLETNFCENLMFYFWFLSFLIFEGERCVIAVCWPVMCFWQGCWSSSWDSLPSSTVGSMLLLRCFGLPTECFTRYLFYPRFKIWTKSSLCSVFDSCDFDYTLQDWWNSTSFANYYRTWNVVVHDWLYYYVYRDFLWVSGSSVDAAETVKAHNRKNAPAVFISLQLVQKCLK